eukprot:GHVQ01001179.1.p1 GENE.GHVQ01001179.1~~GHVQ01001179.1.p1  ORF type:complete len:532 (-),score=120.75 GHVQ01001179.1:3567-5162(-)
MGGLSLLLLLLHQLMSVVIPLCLTVVPVATPCLFALASAASPAASQRASAPCGRLLGAPCRVENGHRPNVPSPHTRVAASPPPITSSFADLYLRFPSLFNSSPNTIESLQGTSSPPEGGGSEEGEKFDFTVLPASCTSLGAPPPKGGLVPRTLSSRTSTQGGPPVVAPPEAKRFGSEGDGGDVGRPGLLVTVEKETQGGGRGTGDWVDGSTVLLDEMKISVDMQIALAELLTQRHQHHISQARPYTVEKDNNTDEQQEKGTKQEQNTANEEVDDGLDRKGHEDSEMIEGFQSLPEISNWWYMSPEQARTGWLQATEPYPTGGPPPSVSNGYPYNPYGNGYYRYYYSPSYYYPEPLPPPKAVYALGPQQDLLGFGSMSTSGSFSNNNNNGQQQQQQRIMGGGGGGGTTRPTLLLVQDEVFSHKSNASTTTTRPADGYSSLTELLELIKVEGANALLGVAPPTVGPPPAPSSHSPNVPTSGSGGNMRPISDLLDSVTGSSDSGGVIWGQGLGESGGGGETEDVVVVICKAVRR